MEPMARLLLSLTAEGVMMCGDISDEKVGL
jgi:hypothetical protein